MLKRPFETGDFFRRFFTHIGDDPDREGLKETPVRVINAWEEIFSGYKQNPDRMMKFFSSDGYDQLILLKDIELYSMCEHHMLPFIGKAHVGYIPKNKVIGISKIARMVDMFSRRLQIQERLTDQIAGCLWKSLSPIGVACVIEAQHLCMRMRGISKQNSIMKTSSLKGIFIEKSEFGKAARQEFIDLIRG
jgi:GTP cyclohydrolase I